MQLVEQISNALIMVFVVYIFYDFFKTLFSYKEERRWLRMVLFFGSVGCILGIKVFQIPILNLLGVPTILFVMSEFVFKGKRKTRIFYTLFYITIMAGSEFVFDYLYRSIFGVDRFLQIMKQYNFVYLVLIEKIIVFMIFKVIQFYLKKTEIEIQDKLFGLFFILPVSSFLIFDGIMFSDYATDLLTTEKIILSVGGFLLLFSNAFVFFLFERLTYMMNKTRRLDLLYLKSEMEKKHYEQLEIINNEHKAFIHDTNKYLSTIAGLAIQKKEDEIIRLVESITTQVATLQNKIYCSNSVLNAILSERSEEAIKKGMKLDIFVEPNLNFSVVDELDLISILGNLIDNAMDATVKCKEKKEIKIKIFCGNDSFIVFEVENEFDGILVKNNDLFKTSKADKSRHGIGLQQVKEIAQKYGGMLQIDAKENEFRISIFLSNSQIS